MELFRWGISDLRRVRSALGDRVQIAWVTRSASDSPVDGASIRLAATTSDQSDVRRMAADEPLRYGNGNSSPLTPGTSPTPTSRDLADFVMTATDRRPRASANPPVAWSPAHVNEGGIQCRQLAMLEQ